MFVKHFSCNKADEEALRFVIDNFDNIESIKLLNFEHRNNSHFIDIDYNTKDGKEIK